MTGITASLRGVRPPELSRQRLRLVAQPEDGRGTTTTTPLPGIDIRAGQKPRNPKPEPGIPEPEIPETRILFGNFG
jgi:hypothetical protein